MTRRRDVQHPLLGFWKIRVLQPDFAVFQGHMLSHISYRRTNEDPKYLVVDLCIIKQTIFNFLKRFLAPIIPKAVVN